MEEGRGRGTSGTFTTQVYVTGNRWSGVSYLGPFVAPLVSGERGRRERGWGRFVQGGLRGEPCSVYFVQDGPSGSGRSLLSVSKGRPPPSSGA